MSAAVQPKAFALRQYKNGQWKDIEDVISTEVPISIYWTVDDEPEQQVTLWTWPDNMEQVVAGHIILEKRKGFTGKIQSEVVQNDPDKGIVVRVTMQTGPDYLRAGNAHQGMDAAELLNSMDDFIGEEGLWDGTGCFHKAGIYCPLVKKVVHTVEDIARHNCIDRLTGWAALRGISLDDKVLLVSARLTRSLCDKAVRAGFTFLVSRSAVTTAAVNLAKNNNATLVGFARTREGRFTLFTDPKQQLR